MEPNDRDTFVSLLIEAAECYQRKLSDATIELYWQALRDLSVVAVERACVEAVKQSTWFPRPAELRAFAFRAAREATATKPGQLRLPDMPHNSRGRAMAQALAELMGMHSLRARVEKLRELVTDFPGVGWEEALAEAEGQQRQVHAARPSAA